MTFYPHLNPIRLQIKLLKVWQVRLRKIM